MLSRLHRKLPSLIILVLSINSYAQVKTVIRHYSTIDGLPDNRITAIVKDSEGFIWLASWLGISRFDGHTFMNFKSYPGDKSNLGSNRIEGLVDDKAGSLWLRSYDNQVYRFDKRTFRFFSLGQVVDGSIPSSLSVAAVLYADSEKVWLKSNSKGLFLLESQADSRFKLSNYSSQAKGSLHLPSNNINFLFSDSKKNVWIGTDKGLKFLKHGNEKEYISSDFPESTGSVFSCIKEAGGKVWLGTTSGSLISFDPQRQRTARYQVAREALNDIFITERFSKIYCTTASGRLLTLSASGILQSEHQVTTGSPLFSIYEDRSGLLWLEPERSGVWKFDPSTKQSKYFEQVNLSNYHRERGYYKVFEDQQNRVWTLMQGWGFGYYDRKNDRIEYFNDDPRSPHSSFSNMINSVVYDEAGVMWLSAMSRGLEKIVFQNSEFNHRLMTGQSPSEIYNEVRAVFADSRGRLWVSAKNTGKLYVYKGGEQLSDLFVNPPSNWQGIYSIIEDRKGRIWLGSKGNGVFLAEPVDTKKDKYTIRHLVSSLAFYSLLEDRKGRIWAGPGADKGR